MRNILVIAKVLVDVKGYCKSLNYNPGQKLMTAEVVDVRVQFNAVCRVGVWNERHKCMDFGS